MFSFEDMFKASVLATKNILLRIYDPIQEGGRWRPRWNMNSAVYIRSQKLWMTLKLED
jgi:hypothetical protein